MGSYNRLTEAVLTSTQNLCFEQKYENIRIFYFFYLFFFLSENFRFFFFCCKIFNIFEKACFRNETSSNQPW